MKKLIIFFVMMFSVLAIGQKKDPHFAEGNDAFDEKQYASAEAEYRISRSKSPDKASAAYNLGNSIYRQNQIAESKSAFLKAIESAKSRPQKHLAYHNLGNVYMKEKNYQQAVEAYKNALRNNPADEETRYNYALAKQYLKDNPPPKDKKDDKKDKKEDKKDDKKKDKKDEPKDEKDKNDQKNQGDQKDQEKPNEGNQPKPKPQPGGISKERLENLLEAVNNEEKKIQNKVNLKKAKGKPVQPEKDW